MVALGSNSYRTIRAWGFASSIALVGMMLNAAQAQNLVTNPGFESGTNDWFSFGPATVVASSGGHSGAACAGIALPTGSSPGIGQRMPPELQPGQTYTWSAWLRVSPTVPPPARSVRLNLYYSQSSTNYVMPVATSILTTTWTQVSAAFEFNVSGAISNVAIGFDGYLASPAFSFFVDDVSLVNSSPKLAMDLMANAAIISWPATHTGYSLQRKSALTVSSWSSVTEPAVTNGGIISVTLSPTNQSRFYRLKK